ncbi:hypothetical protein [Erythrobacter sp. SD-21]|uniref:hypothetical protein n=1 Tax=Erythrobacter sp. SD-21 TaxID=161528 RepID=UPI000153F879|nr:hypothetical protein [Erythrobacter sp. SD-21]EDL49084.1 hypothetical protein ED21_20429 [Erythrobacter sp. SD-21]
MKKLMIAIALTLPAVSACAPPIESVSTRIDAVSSVHLINGSDGDLLIVGDHSRSVVDGVASIDVEDGWHEVTVTRNGSEFVTRRVFVQDGTRRVIDLSKQP